MSSSNRSTPRGGGKGGKLESGSGNKPQKTDTKSDSPKAPDLNPKMQPTAEQMRIAQIIDTRTEDPDLKDKIKQVMDATRKTEDEVCTALHDCDNDPNRAVTMLLEGNAQGEWETTGKKKKNRQPNTTSKMEPTVNNKENHQAGDWNREKEPGPERERSRGRGGGPPRMRGRGSSDSRGWRGRENKENEKNLEDSRDGPRRGGRMMNGPGRSGRGGRGGRMGPRTFQNREKGGFPRSIDTWNNPQVDDNSGETLKMDKWGDDFPSPEDWDNEEYTGSLADTKVFTPSAPSTTIQPALNSEPLQDSTNQDLSTSLSGQNLSNALTSNSVPLPQTTDYSSNLPPTPSQQAQNPVPVGVGVMTAAQTQYLNQLTQATESLKSAVGLGSSSVSGNNSAASSFGAVPSSTSNSYVVPSTATYQPSSPSAFTSSAASFSTSSFGGSVASYSSQMKVAASVPAPVTSQSAVQSLPSRTKTQRPRVPPPSKIPSSAVEMPGDAINSGIGFLDVQFGALEFGSETNSFDFPSDQSKYSGGGSAGLDSVSTSVPTSSLELSSSSVVKTQSSALDGYSGSTTQSGKDLSQSSLSASLGQSQKLPGPESITFPSSQSAEHKSNQSFSQQRGTNSSSSGLDIGKSDSALSFAATSTVTYQPAYQNQKSSSAVYQPSSSYSASSNYTASQVQASSAPYPTGQSQSSFASSQSGSNYSSQASNSYSSNQPTVPTTYPSSQTGSSYTTSQASAASYQPSGQTNSYQTGTSFPSISQSGNSFPSSTQSTATYQNNSQSGFASTSLNQSGSSGYAASTGTSQYQNTYGSSTVTTSQSHPMLHGSSNSNSKLSASINSVKESQYESTTTASSSLSNAIPATTTSTHSTNVNVSPALGLSSTTPTANASTTTYTKVTSSTGKAGVLTNMPPGVPPMLGTHQYIMSQTAGLPYFPGVQQPAVYSYEDLQVLQQRIPHVATGYYDVSFQAPTSLATGRDGSLASVPYSVSDARFARTDNNSSPVPSTLSQQNPTQTHQQPMLNPTAAIPPGYAYFYSGGMMPGGFQYSTPAIYPMATATNAHSATNSTQYPKPGSYGSGYTSAYESLSQSQDFSKAGFVSGSQSQSKGVGGSSGTGGSSGSDLSATMYGKTHVALGKVNSYDKQGFHSGTPPPFNLPGTQTTPMGAPSGAYAAPHLFIPTMTPHQQQHHSTPLIHQPLHQMEMRNPGRRSDSGSTAGQRSQSSSQPNKSGAKQGGYSPAYWASN